MCVSSFVFPSPKEPKGFTRVLMASLMVFPAVILSTATTRQSTSAMAGCLYQRLLFMLVMVTTATTGGGGQDTGSPSVVRILAVFDQSEMETMERVMHKTLIALNKEKTAWTGSSGNGGGRWNRLLNSGIGVNNVTSSINNKKSRTRQQGANGLASNAGPAARLTVDSVTFSSQWWFNQMAEDLGRLIN